MCAWGFRVYMTYPYGPLRVKRVYGSFRPKRVDVTPKRADINPKMVDVNRSSS